MSAAFTPHLSPTLDRRDIPLEYSRFMRVKALRHQTDSWSQARLYVVKSVSNKLYVEKAWNRKLLVKEVEIMQIISEGKCRNVCHMACFKSNVKEHAISSIFMELCTGGDLRTFRMGYESKHKATLPEDVIWDVIRGISCALNYLATGSNLKESGPPGWLPILHADIKEDNIALSSIDGGRTEVHLEDGYRGTLLYNPPESPEIVGLTSDVYCLGATVHRICTGWSAKDTRGLTDQEHEIMDDEAIMAAPTRLINITQQHKRDKNSNYWRRDSEIRYLDYSFVLYELMMLMCHKRPKQRINALLVSHTGQVMKKYQDASIKDNGKLLNANLDWDIQMDIVSDLKINYHADIKRNVWSRPMSKQAYRTLINDPRKMAADGTIYWSG